MSARLLFRRRSLVAAVLSAAVLAGGCGSSGEELTEDVSPNSVDEMRVPKNAEVAIQGRGELKHTFRRDGQMWLVDATAEKTLFTVPVKRGQRVTVAPSEDRAALDRLDVFAGDMQLRNEHRIYYLPKP
jgi:hypothetical protein